MWKILKPMNDKRANYYLLPVYVSILLMVWVGAFFVDMVQMFFDGTLHSSSLVSAQGVRWAVRTALSSINALPWGVVVMLIATYGLLRGSGMMKVAGKMMCVRRLTMSEWRALLFSLVAAVCYGVVLYAATESPWNILSGVTEDAALSPLVQGWALLLFVGVLSVSLIYGFIYGNYSSVMDVVVSTGRSFHLFAPAVMTLLPASGIVPCLQYAGVQPIFGLSWDWITIPLYLLPFIYILLLEARNK